MKARKPSEKPCDKSCKGRVLNSGVYCDCIEKKLPSLKNNRSAKLVYTDGIERFPAPTPESSFGDDPARLVEKLIRYGLNPYEVNLIMARINEDKTFQEIVEEQGWTSIGTAHFHFRQALKKLRERGFKPG